MHGEDDQIRLPNYRSTVGQALKYGTLKSYPGLPHGMPTMHADQINAELLAFVQQQRGELAA
jgi:non-heme chloroperoxidase